MKISSFKILFFRCLDRFYDSKELENLFYMFCESLLKLKPHQVLLNFECNLPSQKEKKCLESLERLKNNEPIQYVLGTTYFMGFNFQVTSNVLIPRPETEELVDLILKDHKNLAETFRVLDIGTGSGCIAISLAKKHPLFEVSAIDISREALKISKKNSQNLKAPVTFSNLDILSTKKLEDHYDIIVSNPPYVCLSERKDMKPNILDFEPPQALFVEDSDPLIFYKQIIKLASKNTCLYFEINPLCVKEMEKKLLLRQVQDYQFSQDFRGKIRFLKILK